MRLVKSMRGTTLATLLTFGLAACGESPLAPVPESPALSPEASDPLMARRGYVDDDSDDSDAYKHDDRSKSGMRTFKIRPGKPVLKKLGEHVLWVPANVVCDPATSGYGQSYWNAPCQPIKRPIEVTAKWVTVNGHTVIRFKPELRFVPSTDRNRWVILWAKYSKNVDPTVNFAVLWRNPETSEWVDEAAGDPTLRIQVQSGEKLVSRRLKHFSDYLFWAGYGSFNVTSGWGDGFDPWGGW